MATTKLRAKPASTVTPLQILLLLSDCTTESQVAADCKIAHPKLSRAKYNAYRFTDAERKRMLAYFNLPRSFDFDLLIDKGALKHLLSMHLAKQVTTNV